MHACQFWSSLYCHYSIARYKKTPCNCHNNVQRPWLRFHQLMFCRGGNIQTDCESMTRICKWGTIILAQASWQTNVPPLWGSCFLSQVIIIFPLFQLHQYPSTIPKNNITWDKKLTTTHINAWQTYLEKIVFINSIDLLERLQLNFSIPFTPTL